MYDLTGAIDIDGLSAVEPGTSLLVSGPAMTGKDDLLLEVLADGLRQGDGAIAMSTDDDAGRLVATLEERAPGYDPYQLAVLDCRGSGDQPEIEGVADAHHVGAPSDLTGIGIGITNGFDRLGTAGVEQGRLGLTSLSTMITYTDTETVFKFCHVLGSRLDSAGFIGAFTVDSKAHDSQTLQVVQQAFDGMIEIREQDGTRQARLKGLHPEPSEWTRL
jgi:KaiC/GvpD/RAD55 family RecA-like ATPase